MDTIEHSPTGTSHTVTGVAGPTAAGDLLPIRGVLLRSVLLLELDRAGRSSGLTVAELCDAVHRRGFTVTGRISKVVSDALRWETARGRVFWVDRGRYRIGRLPRTTRWRARRRVAAALADAAPAHHLAAPGAAPAAGSHPAVGSSPAAGPRPAAGSRWFGGRVVAQRRNGEGPVPRMIAAPARFRAVTTTHESHRTPPPRPDPRHRPP